MRPSRPARRRRGRIELGIEGAAPHVMFLLSHRTAVLAGEDAVLMAVLQIGVGIEAVVFWVPRTDFEIGYDSAGSVDQVMPVRDSRRKARGHARPERLLAGIGDEHRLALDDVDELVLATVPMANRRP